MLEEQWENAARSTDISMKCLWASRGADNSVINDIPWLLESWTPSSAQCDQCGGWTREHQGVPWTGKLPSEPVCRNRCNKHVNYLTDPIHWYTYRDVNNAKAINIQNTIVNFLLIQLKHSHKFPGKFMNSAFYIKCVCNTCTRIICEI